MSAGRRARPPILLAAAGLGAVALLALPLVYLVLRAAGGDAWDVLLSDNLAHVVWETAVLVVAVTASAVKSLVRDPMCISVSGVTGSLLRVSAIP